MKRSAFMKKALPLFMIGFLISCGPAITIKPTNNLEEGAVKTINAEVTSSCRFTRVYAFYKRNNDTTWINSGPSRQGGNLFSSDIPGSQTFSPGDVYNFRWAVDYDSRPASIFSPGCKTVPPETLTADSSFTVLGCIPGISSNLPVPMHPQQTPQWCWAASGRMIMDYLGNNVDQCTQANDSFGRTDCCNDGGGICGLSLVVYPIFHSACINPGWPDFNRYGFTNTRFTNAALSWDDLRKQLSDAPYCRRSPVAFSWNWDGGGAHMMVARGFHILYVPVTDAPDTIVNYVHIHDPWLPCFGDSRIITYDEYVARAGDHTHGRDYFDIRP